MKFRTLVTDASRLGFAARDALRGAVALVGDAFNEADHPREGGKFASKEHEETHHALTSSGYNKTREPIKMEGASTGSTRHDYNKSGYGRHAAFTLGPRGDVNYWHTHGGKSGGKARKTVRGNTATELINHIKTNG